MGAVRNRNSKVWEMEGGGGEFQICDFQREGIKCEIPCSLPSHCSVCLFFICTKKETNACM